MAEVTTPKGVKYCIDTLEVSQSDYAEFLKRTTAKPGSEHPDCASNLSYLPVQDIDDPYEKKTCLKGKDWSPETTPNRPVVCVDWCDAHAYCQSAGKRLCGKVGGGSGSADDVSNADLSQWFAACSQGGMTAFPYGDTYDAQRCRGSEVSKLASGPGEAWLPQTDTAAWPNCRGSSPPYSSILNMSGLVAEHTDERLWVEGPAGGAWSCIDRGGNFRDSEPRLTCANFGSGSCGASPLVGFRCCKDLQ
jgi:formylglycine-generating enzyme required for sulfatase activity